MSLAGGIPEWHRQEERRLTYEWIATQRAAAEWKARKARRRAILRRCAHWCNPLVQVVSDVGQQVGESSVLGDPGSNRATDHTGPWRQGFPTPGRDR